MLLRTRIVVAATVAVLALSTAIGAATKSTANATKKPAPKAPAAAKSPVDVFGAAGPDAVVATVNGTKITKKQVLDYLWGFRVREGVESLITMELVKQKAKQNGVAVTQKDVDAKIQDVVKPLGGKTIGQALAEAGVSRQIWVENWVKPQVMVEKIISKKAKVSDADIAQFIKARHILINVPYGPGDEGKKNQEAAKAEVDKIVEEIKGGLDFAAAADKYSKDQGNADPTTGEKKGGLLPWFKKDSPMAKEFLEAAFALKPGEMSQPVLTQYGWHIIKVEKLGKDATPAERTEIKDLMMRDEMAKATPVFWQELRTGAKIVNNVVPAPKPETSITPPKPPAGASVRPAPARGSTAPATPPKPPADNTPKPAGDANTTGGTANPAPAGN